MRGAKLHTACDVSFALHLMRPAASRLLSSLETNSLETAAALSLGRPSQNAFLGGTAAFNTLVLHVKEPAPYFTICVMRSSSSGCRYYDPVADAKQKRQAALNRWTVRHEAQKATDGLLTADKPFSEKSAGDKVDSKSSSQSPVQEV